MAPRKGTKPWNAGTGKGWTDRRGYRWISVMENGKYRAKREHRHIMEQHLSRVLHPEELVHHKNGVLDDNRIANLEIMTWGEHTTNHHMGSKRPEEFKRTVSVMANYREDNKRLKEINADLLEALEAVMNNALTHPSDMDGAARNAVVKANSAVAKSRGETR